MSTGPQWFPGANTGHRYDSVHRGSDMEVNVVVWHSTEGTSLPTYGGGASAPTLTAVPDFKAKKLRWYQHFPFDESARALVNKPGGVETNTLNVAQVEVVGTCDPATHKKWGKTPHLYMPELPDWAIRDLAAFALWANDKHKVPLTSGVKFKAYPDSYGNDPVRMTFAEWTRFKGHCGHQHVPENDHGDPGAFPMDEILAKARGGVAPEPPKTDSGLKPVPTQVGTVHVSNVIAAYWHDRPAKQGATSHPVDVRQVENALHKLGYLAASYARDGSFGTATETAFNTFRRAIGLRGSDATGAPGKYSLTELGQRSGLFKVRN